MNPWREKANEMNYPPLSDREWEWSADEIKLIGYRVVGMIASHLTTLPEKPVFRPFPAELAVKCLDSKPPELGQEADDILATFAPDIEPYPFGNGHPRLTGG
jgi:aromatic-L-amino-acid/L-tryptophan decarboxylase